MRVILPNLRRPDADGDNRGKYDSRPQFLIAIGGRLKYDSLGEQIKDDTPCHVLYQAMKQDIEGILGVRRSALQG